MATRKIDLQGGIDYGKWSLESIVSHTFNTAVLATTDVLADTSVGGVSYPGELILEDGIMRVIVAENTGAVFWLNITRFFGTVLAATSLMSYNAGVALAANCLYMFDVPVLRGDVVNFQFGAGTTILMLNVGMLITMGG